MGFLDESFIGYDFNRDGKINRLDDMMHYAAYKQAELDRQKKKLKDTGLDWDSLECMNEYERNIVIAKAGFNPDDFEF